MIKMKISPKMNVSKGFATAKKKPTVHQVVDSSESDESDDGEKLMLS